MPTKIDFIKGHMGGNEIVLLYGDQVKKGKEVQTALFILDSPNIGGHQAALLYRSPSNAELKVKIVDVTARSFITMCGGLTQVIGKTLIEAGLGEKFNIELKEPTLEITLHTDVGAIPLKVEHDHGQVKRTLANMSSFVDECYKLEVEPINL